jgi:hypothetical protein
MQDEISWLCIMHEDVVLENLIERDQLDLLNISACGIES